MKAIKIFFLLISAGLPGLSLSVNGQKNITDIKKKIESQDFIFIPQSASPARGGFVQLTPGFDVTVTKNNVVSYLPFFGRAQIAPMNPTDGGIKFSSAGYEYNIVAIKKGWRVTLKPNDVSGVQQLFFTIWDDGTADLNVINSTRDNISFSGYIK